jgi:hypothetical protein
MDDLIRLTDKIVYINKNELSLDSKQDILGNDFYKYKELEDGQTKYLEDYTKPITDYYSKKKFIKDEREQIDLH